jgi:hypothetical protein
MPTNRTPKSGLIAAAVLASTLTLGLIAGPAGAARKPTTKHTTITLKAAKATVAPKHKVSLTATLQAGHTALAGQQLCVESRVKAIGATWGTFGSCTNLSSLTASDGTVTIDSVVPRNGKGTKEQFKVLFAGATGYSASHSPIVTITVATS